MTDKLYQMTAPVEEDVDLEFYAIEAADPDAPATAPKALVAVVADVSAERALEAVKDRWGHLYQGKQLSARIVAPIGEPAPLEIHGWMHFDGPESARCPACRRAFAVIPKGFRWSVRLVGDPKGKGTRGGQGIHRCVRSACRKDMEIIVTGLN